MENLLPRNDFMIVTAVDLCKSISRLDNYYLRRSSQSHTVLHALIIKRVKENVIAAVYSGFPIVLFF